MTWFRRFEPLHRPHRVRWLLWNLGRCWNCGGPRQRGNLLCDRDCWHSRGSHIIAWLDRRIR